MPTTVLKFRRQLEYNTLRERLFERVNAVLRAHGLLLDKGTVVDDTIIAAPSSTKNQEKARDPDMHQTRKDNQWYFGMKAHIGADLHSGAVHSLTCTAANVADITATANLLHGREATVCADAGYIGADKREALQERDGRWHIAEKRGKLATMDDGPVKYLAKQAKRLQAQIRARRTPVPRRQEPLRPSQGALPGAEEEHDPPAHPVRPGQSLPAAQAADGLNAGEVRPATGCASKKLKESGPTRPKTQPHRPNQALFEHVA